MIKHLRELSGHLAAAVRDKPEETLEERFYLCPIKLAKEIEPETKLTPGKAQENLSALCRSQGIEAKVKDVHGKGFWPYICIPGSEAERRWPALILAKQLRPIQVRALGIEEATWSELLWGAWQWSLQMSPESMENLARSPTMLEMQRWRATWSPPEWRRAKEEPTTIGEALLRELNHPHEHPNDLFRDIDLLLPLIDVSYGPTRTASHWDTQGWLELGWWKMLDRVNIKEKELAWELEGLEGAMKLAATAEAGHWEKQGSRRRTSMAWGPFPSLGRGITLVALDSQNCHTTVALIQRLNRELSLPASQHSPRQRG